MNQYVVLGAKEGEFKAYQTINYVSTLVDNISQEEVDEYHPAFSKILKWINLAIDTRKQDIIRRKATIKRDREDREHKIQ